MSIVRVFYLPQAYQNMLLVRVSDQDVAFTQSSGKVHALFDRNKQLIGYNIVDETYESEVCGYQPMNEALLVRINEALKYAGFDSLVHDDTPRLIVGYIESCEPHPNSDHLHVCQVNVGSGIKQIVCGSVNVKVHIHVVVALDQAVMPDGKWILSGQLRGVDSEGMLCSRYELGVDDEKGKGLLILSDDSVVGTPYQFAIHE